MVVYTPEKKFDCSEVNQICLKMLIDESGQEYLLLYAFAEQYLYSVEREKGKALKFTYIDRVMQVKDELQCKRIGLTLLLN